MSYEAVIGLEIHAQLLTETKIFCGCRTAFGSPPNTHVCPTCLGLPGALPVLNRKAVDLAVRASLALGCRIEPISIFARKNYFYPDLPKGYQISQYERPLAVGGALDYVVGADRRHVGIIRVHLEEDAGKSLHEGFADSDRRTYVDFNRSGVPLIEIVTQPDLQSAADAADFFARLRAILVWLEVNDGNMEEGSLRCDANVSVRDAGADSLGTKVEVKNLNSFRFLQKALDFEIERQIRVLEGGRSIVQETRLWDQTDNRTIAMRSKEEAHDYRYFPEPDLPPLIVDRDTVERVSAAMPELPEARKHRFVRDYGVPDQTAASLVHTARLADYFEAAARASGNAKAAANWVMGELARKMNDLGIDIGQVAVAPPALGALIALVDRGVISGSVAKDVFEKMCASGRSADEIVRAEGLAQIDDESALSEAIAQALAAHPDAVSQYRSGKVGALGFIVGQVMKATGGKANPRKVNELVKQTLDRAD